MLFASGGLSAEPIVLLEALAERASTTASVTTARRHAHRRLLCAVTAPGQRDPGSKTWFIAAEPCSVTFRDGARRRFPADDVDAGVVVTVETLKIDVCPDHGVARLTRTGTTAWGISSSLNSFLVKRSPRRYIAQVNDEMPYTLGDSLVQRVADRLHSRALEPVGRRTLTGRRGDLDASSSDGTWPA